MTELDTCGECCIAILTAHSSPRLLKRVGYDIRKALAMRDCCYAYSSSPILNTQHLSRCVAACLSANDHDALSALGH